MPSNSSPSTRTSLVSIEPAVASHIIDTKPFFKTSHARAGSSPAKTQTPWTIGHSRGHSRANSAPGKNNIKRSTSLRRTKNSTEMLRQRSKRGDDGKLIDTPGDPKRGRNFTVTNVGTGGMLYLQPSAYQNPVAQALTSLSSGPFSAPLTGPVPTLLVSQEDEYKTRVTTVPAHRRFPSSRTRSVSPKRLLERVNKSKESKPISRPSHTRSQSFSTLDESRRSFTDIWPKTLRIVINRNETVHTKSREIESKPALEIPIPHYRLGVPRFSSHGTPILRSSTYSQSSLTSSIQRVSTIKSEPTNTAPPPASLRAFAKLQIQGPSSQINHTDSLQASKTLQAEDPHRASKSLSVGYAPSIYDDLNEVYNDSSVVRFAHDVRDVTAATPARIIAQISSESFMDYELVSDFFLTFRSYMSTTEVLDLLLARLAWAVGRMSDDGRIIRIRTFAALRHWILNYFMDDFVPHRLLRLRFCEEVNDLFYDVKTKQIGGPSDLKILQDLKRCWNGRCSLYWDGEVFNMDSNQEEDLVPGGVVGSRNPSYSHIREAKPSSSQAELLALQSAPLPERPDSPLQTRSAPGQKHRRHFSYASSGPAESAVSEQSIQPNSCSIPLTMPRTTTDAPVRLRKPQPVNVQERRLRAPSDLKVTTSRSNSKSQHHRRGGNSFDSTRERTPLPPEPPSAVPLPEPHDGSVIRGFVYPPVEPFVQIPLQMPLSPAGPIDQPSAAVDSRRTNDSHTLQGGPAVKNVFGSIRRALGGKQGPSEMTLIAISNPQSNPSLQTKRSQKPLSTSPSHDELRHTTPPAVPVSPIRIDLLCAAAIESYQATVAVDQYGSLSTLQRLNKDPTLPRGGFSSLSPQIRDIDRVQSHITAQSGSILIVDGTALGDAVMSGAMLSAHPHSNLLSEQVQSMGPSQDQQNLYEVQNADEDDTRNQDQPEHSKPPEKPQVPDQAPENIQALPQAVGLNKAGDLEVPKPPENLNSSTASTTTVKHRKSLASSVVQVRSKASVEETASSVTVPPEERAGTPDSLGWKQPTQTLRRRPGGDLRKNQNVHDLESPAPNHESLDSLAETISSQAESLLVVGTALPVNPYAIPKDSVISKNGLRKVSMINTHSSQHLRPSFEAAVAGFSAIPDDDDGGLEATLLKLEGRYEKRSPEVDASPSTAPTDTFAASITSTAPQAKGNSSPLTSRSTTSQVKFSPEILYRKNLSSEQRNLTDQQVFAHKQAIFGLPTESDAESEDSERSVPLLQRASIAVPREGGLQFLLASEPMNQNNPLKDLKAADHPSKFSDGLGIHNIGDSRSASRPMTSHTEQSFLLDEDEHLSDLSSEMSVDIINYSEAMGSASSPLLVAPGTAISGLEIPSHPLAHSSFVNLPMHSNLALDGNYDHTTHPLTPEPSPVIRRSKKSIASKRTQESPKLKSSRTPISVGPAHIPFILACDSQMLAQQLTLVEQSALTEIEWVDLVEMRWSSSPANVLDWAEYVVQENIKGIDLVVTRFNLMVKWALSEIVLTQNIRERVRVVSKLIHVAAHARRLHNYATMLQLTIALTSVDCTHLVQTWQLVPDPDKSLLKNMEALIQPIRNFHDLRLEMESADLTDGCIPFIGLYVHDLTYNAQKPSEIDAGKNRPPLVNFEKFRTTAVIVKGLLRLIDASSRYNFDPVHGVIERCLWIASLEDDRIRSLSKTLETP